MMNKFNSSSYEITPLTLAVISRPNKDGKIETLALEEHDEYRVQHSPSKIIDQACKFFGSSLKGRQEGTRDIYGIKHKAPICIDPFSGMYFLPTLSPANPSCSWIAHSHVKTLHKAANSCTEIEFKNGRRIVLEASYGILLNQLERTAQFRYLLEERIKYLQRRTEMVAEPFA
ncbi:competence protein ComK [Virgibacillus sp. 179-BFC.A HS]|uniref:Competence protein ComK n=1 Tax=Tigheibacillus jepli TaxID=3035914 RepID=A0ABU5CK64_9BACI|nr:competence protein ComK [Virgibacillus sp. 179-BFC.A HS]MDY0406214.1 competence protein ComK [Virgibacillus sp. 179-BFC.A HS]